MLKPIFTVLLLTLLAGCETSTSSRPAFSDKNYPEFDAHITCMSAKIEQYRRSLGSPLELGTIASVACNRTRYALNAAIAKDQGAAFARGYTRASEENDPKIIAGEMIRRRGY